MCILCGEMINNIHWSEGAQSSENEIIVGSLQRDRMRHRLQKVKITNKILIFYGLKLSEWNGAKFILTDKKGRTEIVNHLGELWHKVAQLSTKEVDVLDSKLLDFLREQK